jgi:hypothetical protein
MPRLTHQVPTYRKHRASGQAIGPIVLVGGTGGTNGDFLRTSFGNSVRPMSAKVIVKRN